MAKIQQELQIRVRPPRIMVITSSHTSQKELLKVFEFLSMVRGGVYARFLHADMRDLSFIDHIKTEAKKVQPEIVIPASEQDQRLICYIFDYARPKVVTVPKDFFTNFSESATGGLLPWYRVVTEEVNKYPNLKRDNIFLLRITASDEFAPFVAASYGVLDNKLIEYLHHVIQAQVHEVSVTTAEELYTLHSFMRTHVSWLDFLNQGLKLIHSDWYPPTIVLSSQEEPLQDIGLFWNLRHHIAPRGRDESLLLFREQDADNNNTLKALSETLAMSEINSNYCVLKSSTCSKKILDDIAQKIYPILCELKEKEYPVDVETTNSPPWVSCYEKNTHVTATCDNSIVSIPKVALNYSTHSTFESIYADLVDNSKTNRYPFEYALPKDVDILELLNTTASSFYSWQSVVSFGNECLSVFCNGSESPSMTRFQLPSEHEIFEIILDRADCKLLLDEKNTRYSSFLGMLDSLHAAALALCGKSWDIINAFLPKEKEPLLFKEEPLLFKEEPLLFNELFGKAKLGKPNQLQPLPEIAKLVHQQYNGKLRSIAERRIRSSLDVSLTSDSTPTTILNFLVDHRILQKKWIIDDCPGCRKRFWISTIDLATPLQCPGCTSVVPLQKSANIGYELNSLVALAITEGMRTVILTARFLKNLTHNGFIFYPGAKLEAGNKKTDIDLFAIADEILIAGECKTLSESKKYTDENSIWDEILQQLQQPIEIARKAGVRIFFISSFVDEYPQKFQDELKNLAGDSLIILFLTKQDIEDGIRKIDINGQEGILDMHSILHPDSFNAPSFDVLKEKMQDKSKFIRTMTF